MKGERGRELLSVRDLTTVFGRGDSAVVAVDGISLSVRAGRIAALVGESGSGKSAAALSVMGLIDPPGRVEAGEIFLNGRDLRRRPLREWNACRGRDMAMIFQDPMNALNPVLPIGRQLIETIRRHRRVSGAEARAIAIAQLERAELHGGDRLLRKYAFELSGGMCQRIMIALALVSGAKLLIADEPTTALDVGVQAQILRELDRVRREEDVGILLITHDLGVVAELADEVYVMRSGRIVEHGEVFDVFDRPRHEYTRELLDSRL
ncbi:ABC transporter ATP-binding protein [Saccharibacillus sp. CPCC 101409]|uniref:ABC transporter ATP-binding protein n=1 Tax=Saccharibacillus sp. CPCC 101409 TaxID=3058041 RepID=UPI0026719B4A|nr:ABC transporter ATP-binding protein [Saccharibacillus sp. CPCC 101409]MDO3410330.1 ABC transporter ATP-binding protein [Saccharibacillus sp. CPCC 101409]